jgi:YggT family protein
MNGFFSQAGIYLVQVFFGLYLFAVLLRFLLQLVRGDFYNPIAQFLVVVTNPVILPLRRIVPGFFGIDWASVITLIAVKLIEKTLVWFIKGISLAVVPLVYFSILDLLYFIVWFFFIAIIIRVILSWFAGPMVYQQPAGAMLYRLSEPLMRPARRLIPPIGGLDLSPLLVIVGLELIKMALLHLGAGF